MRGPAGITTNTRNVDMTTIAGVTSMQVLRPLVNQLSRLFQNGVQDTHAFRRTLHDMDSHAFDAVEDVMVPGFRVANDEATTFEFERFAR